MRIANQKNITIGRDLSLTPGSFVKKMMLNFKPDQMVVKAVTYTSAANPTLKLDGSVLVHCSTINEDLASIWDRIAYNPNLIFNAKNYTFNTEWTFKLVDSTGVIDTGFNVGELFIHLEFIQFADK